MTDQKPTRSDILRPLHLVGLALAAGVFGAVVTLVSTGAFTERVNLAISKGTYEGLTPVSLGLVVGGASFIVTLLGLSMLMLAVNPSDVTKTIDHGVLLDKDGAPSPSETRAAEAPDAPASGSSETGTSESPTA